MRYPEAERLDLVEDLHGNAVADPYRWLEDVEDQRTAEWSKAQDELARGHLDALPGREHVRRRLRELMVGHISAPTMRGRRAFFSRRRPGQEHAQLIVREPDGTERVLLDPAARSDDDTITLEAVVVSLEGERVAYLLADAGTEDTSLFVLDVDTGLDIEGPLEIGRGGDLAWLAGGEELVVVRRVAGLPEDERQFHRRVWRHRVGTTPEHDVLLFGEGRDRTTYYDVRTSPDGRWLTIACNLGTAPRNDLYLLDLSQPDEAPRVLQEGVDAQTFGAVSFDGRLYLHTNEGAPRWRLVVADPHRPGPDEWRELLAEDESVLEGFAVTRGAVAAVRSLHAVSSVSLHDRETGVETGRLALPGAGTASVVARVGGGDDLWVGYTDHVTPLLVLHHDVASGETTTWATAPGTLTLDGFRREQVFVTSRDGTQIPMFLLRVEGATGPAPATLYGYGGFNVAQTPAYAPGVLAWVEAGGVYAIACLRGGSEEGEAWHRAGMREQKQNVFDDFHACAEWLIANGHTTVDQLAVAGGSNGGLLVGAALTQRPDLFAAVVCSAPLLDMVRYERFGLGVTWNDEYGTAEDPDELAWLLGYSPYHRVVRNTPYPAVLFTVFEGDTRVDPLHARKLCAALQWATSAPAEERPIVIRSEENVGHGGRSVSRTIDLGVDSITFRAAQTGLVFPAT